MILPQVHLRQPCYDFFFLQYSTFTAIQKSSQFTLNISRKKRRAVCTFHRDVFRVLFSNTLTRDSFFKSRNFR